MIILAYQGWNRSLLAAEVPEPCIMHYFLGISICNSRYLVTVGRNCQLELTCSSSFP